MMNLRLFTVVLIALFFSHCSTSTESESKYNPPADHTISEDGAKHKPGLDNPTLNCASCHGNDLRGSETAPSCYTCHGKKWD
jgi:hypothetical protein